ncbi:MAG: Gfo/Idh/MocA family oxidoreductase [Victivallales bacterium]|nr:Gfo/Idh/MocA family oxidoreductase [Victivallales bacterium]
MTDLAHLPEQGVEIVAGADIYELQRKSFQDRYREKFHSEVKAYADYREMLERERPDGVFIIVPDYLHEEMACHCLSQGVPVYLEKPIAISIDGADRILHTAYEHKTQLFLGHNMRYMGFTEKMHEIVQSGAIGEVKAIWCRHFISYGGDAYYRDWHADRRKSCSLLLQKGSHDIDIIHWLANSRTARVHGFGTLAVYGDVPRRPAGEEHPANWLSASQEWKRAHWPPETLRDFYPIVDVEDLNMIGMQLTNGVQACYLQCHFTPDCVRNYTVIGTRGRLENRGDYHGNVTIEVWTRRSDTYQQEGDITYRIDVPKENHGGADFKIITGFIQMLRGEARPIPTPQSARYAVAAGILGAESIRSGGNTIELPPLPPELENYNFSQVN